MPPEAMNDIIARIIADHGSDDEPWVLQGQEALGRYVLPLLDPQWPANHPCNDRYYWAASTEERQPDELDLSGLDED